MEIIFGVGYAVYEDNNNQWKISLTTTGLSTNYNYDDIQIEAEIISKIYGSEKVNVKCRVDGSCTGTTNLTYNWYSNDRYEITVNVLDVKGKLKTVK